MLLNFVNHIYDLLNGNNRDNNLYVTSPNDRLMDGSSWMKRIM